MKTCGTTPTVFTSGRRFLLYQLKILNLDLVKNAMKNVKLDVASIPLWAKEISESAWNEVVQRTVKGTANATTASAVENES